MIDLINEHRASLQHILGLLIGFAMVRCGSGPERASAVIFVGLIILPVMVFALTGNGAMMFGNFAWMYVALDLLAFAGFMWVALNANRNYPLWLAGFQLVAMGAHTVRMLNDVVSPLAYVILAVGPSYGQLLIMTGGLVRHVRRERLFGRYRDWRVGHGSPRLTAMLSDPG
jgi:hypothetical protein